MSRGPVAAKGTALDVMAKAMTEDQLQAAITGMLDAHHIRWHHETDSRRSKSGFPDLLVVGSRVEFWELKRHDGKVSPDQHEFLSDLVRAGATARVVRPMHLLAGTVERWVRGLR